MNMSVFEYPTHTFSGSGFVHFRDLSKDVFLKSKIEDVAKYDGDTHLNM